MTDQYVVRASRRCGIGYYHSETPSQVVVEATPVSSNSTSRSVPIIYAESARLSFKHFLRARWLCGILLFVILIIVVVAVVSVLILQTKDTESNDGVISINASSSPTAAPSFLLDDALHVTSEYSGAEALETPNSPQLKAVGWISSKDMVNLDDDEALLQRYAMATLVFGLNVDQWFSIQQSTSAIGATGISCDDDVSERLIVTGIRATPFLSYQIHFPPGADETGL